MTTIDFHVIDAIDFIVMLWFISLGPKGVWVNMVYQHPGKHFSKHQTEKYLLRASNFVIPPDLSDWRLRTLGADPLLHKLRKKRWPWEGLYSGANVDTTSLWQSRSPWDSKASKTLWMGQDFIRFHQTSRSL